MQVISLLRKDWAGNNSVKWGTDTGFTNELHACIISSGTQGLEASGFHGFFIFHFTKYNIEGHMSGTSKAFPYNCMKNLRLSILTSILLQL